MKSMVLALAAVATLVAGASFGARAVTDANGDGFYSKAELRAAYPRMSDEDFSDADADGDGKVSPEELEGAREGGALPPN